MAMVSLLIAPLIDGNEDWKLWYVGLIILVICLVATLVLMYMKILTWQDPLGTNVDEPKSTKSAPDNGGTPQMTPVSPVDPSGPAQAWPGQDPAPGAVVE